MNKSVYNILIEENPFAKFLREHNYGVITYDFLVKNSSNQIKSLIISLNSGEKLIVDNDCLKELKILFTDSTQIQKYLLIEKNAKILEKLCEEDLEILKKFIFNFI